MLSKIFKQSIPHLIAAGIFLLCSAMYFSPQLQGKKLPQSDITSFRGMSQEIFSYNEKEGRKPLWTNSMFGGMPAYQVSMDQKSNLFSYLDRISKLFMTGPMGLFFGMMISAYFALILMKIDFKIAIIAAIGFAFSTYNILLLDGGHNSKINTIGYLGLLVSGMYLAYERNKHLWGLLVFAVGFALSVYANHVQMTYYFVLVLGLYFLIKLIETIKSKEWASFGKATGALFIAGILGFLTSSQRMLPTYEYAKDTMRGKPILTQSNNPGSSSAVDGLAWDYAMRWSHKPIDLVAMIVPGAAGGGNEIVKPGSKLAASLNLRSNSRFPLYWGGLDSTGGPAYMSIVFWFFLIYFVLASKQSIRWWFVAAIVFLSLMSLGKYFESFNKLLFDLLPYLNKFRAPGSISSVIAIPLYVGGAMGIHHLFSGKSDTAVSLKKIKLVAIGLGSFIVLAILGGLVFNSFSALNDARWEQAGILDVVIEARKSLLVSTGLRSLIIAGLCFVIGLGFLKNWFKPIYGIIGLGLLITADLWQMDKKYLSNDKFVQANLVENPIRPRPVDNLIQKDGGLYFRVHDVTADPWNSAIASYYHKTIGGYSPVKLQRYEDIKERYLIQGNQNVLNMLNTRYIISNQNNTPTANVNTAALGNAWFVSEYFLVNSADEEINGVNGIDPAQKAIIHNEFGEYMNQMQISKNGTIELTEYHPEKLTYTSNTSSDQLAIFSDMWYGPNKGWNAYIDGKPVEHIRANYLLRAMKIPAGDHKIEFKFEPRVVKWSSILSLITSILLLGAGGWMLFRNVSSNKIIDQIDPNPKRLKTTKKKKISKTKSSKSRKKK